MNIEGRYGLRKVKFSRVGGSEKDIEIGYFHKWVTYAEDGDCEELALIEVENGEVVETYTTRVCFIKED